MGEFNSAEILKQQNRRRRFAALEVGLFEISFVLIIIIVLFGLLNYFNILSLSTLYPNQLGFLPHQPLTANTQQKQTVPTPTPASNFIQAEPSDIQSYKELAKQKNINLPSRIPQSNNFVAVGIFSGYNNQALQIINPEGILTLNFNENTEFATLNSSDNKSSTAGGLLGTSQKYNQANDFFVNVRFGSFLQIFYATKGGNLEAVRVYYIPDYKFNK